VRVRRAAVVASLLMALAASPAAAAGTLTLPFAQRNPAITAWMDHHYPTRQEDGVMVRYDGRTEFAYDGHRGTDYAVGPNTPVVAADDGVVIYADWSDTGGWGVVLEHAFNRTAYFHNNRLFVYPEQHVSRGQLIALSGSTGNSTGPHLHFEVRDRRPLWHSIDPFGWTGSGRDPWRFDEGYLWSSNPPQPFMLPLVFLSGARWNAWYGLAEEPPPVSWRVQDGLWGFSGLRMAWDADPGGPMPGPAAGRAGTTGIPGPGRHTLHLRVWDRAEHTADITYQYLVDHGRPVLDGGKEPAGSSLLALRWSARDAESGVRGFRSEIQVDGGPWGRWFDLLPAEAGDAPPEGEAELPRRSHSRQEGRPPVGAFGRALLVGLPGHDYRMRTSALNHAGNASDPGEQSSRSADRAAALGELDRVALPLPAAPAGRVPTWSLARAEVRAPADIGGYVLDAWGGILPVGGAPPLSLPRYEPGTEWAADLLLLPEGGGYVVTTEGRLVPVGTAPPLEGAPLARGQQAVRGALVPGGAIVVDQRGGFTTAAPAGSAVVAPVLAHPIPPGATVLDLAALRDGTGFVLDSSGRVHAFAPPGTLAPSAAAFPPDWSRPAPPRALALAPSGAGYLVAADGSLLPVGSILFQDETRSGPFWDPRLGLAIR